MKIARDCVVRFDYTLRSDAGEILDTSEGSEPLTYLHGRGQIVPGLEAAMTDRSTGDTFAVKVAAADGYGEREEGAVFEVPRNRLPPGLDPQVGMQLGMRTPEGHVVPVRVVGVRESTIQFDGNHPLAGENLHFEVAIRDVRAATADEIAHGHAHGPGGTPAH